MALAFAGMKHICIPATKESPNPMVVFGISRYLDGTNTVLYSE